MWVIGAVIIVGGFVGSLVWSSHESWRRQRAWQDAALGCGLQSVGPSDTRPGLEARQEPLRVLIKDAAQKTYKARIAVAVPGPPDFYNLRILPEPPMRLPWEREIEIGDAAFDSTFSIEGQRWFVFALLDVETRRLLSLVNAKSQLKLRSGSLVVETPDEQVAAILPLLLEIGQRFVRSMNHPLRCLAENANRDPEVQVRLRSLHVLIREFPEDEATLATLRAACTDWNPEIRLRAAEALGTEGYEVLLRFVDSTADDALRAQAISLLNRTSVGRRRYSQAFSFERATAVLERALRERHIQTACACLEVIGYSGEAAALDVLVKVVSQEKGEPAAVAARVLGKIGNAAAEPSLIRALKQESTEVQVAAANALGRIGSAVAVLPLKEAAERSWRNGELRRAARQAIAEIQSRLKGGSPGQLSLTEAETGQLSLAQEEGGQLSLADDQAGQLSLPPDETG